MFRWMQSLSSNQTVHELQAQARHKLKHRLSNCHLPKGKVVEHTKAIQMPNKANQMSNEANQMLNGARKMPSEANSSWLLNVKNFIRGYVSKALPVTWNDKEII